jgi:hypothetical protein
VGVAKGSMAFHEMPPTAFALKRQAYDRIGPVELGYDEHQVSTAQGLHGFDDSEVMFNRTLDFQWSITQCNDALNEHRLKIVTLGSDTPLIYVASNGTAVLVDEWPLERHGSARFGRITPSDLWKWAMSCRSNFLDALMFRSDLETSSYRLVRRTSGKIIIRRNGNGDDWPSVALTEDRDRAFWLGAFRCHWSHSGECSRGVQQLAP